MSLAAPSTRELENADTNLEAITPVSRAQQSLPALRRYRALIAEPQYRAFKMSPLHRVPLSKRNCVHLQHMKLDKSILSTMSRCLTLNSGLQSSKDRRGRSRFCSLTERISRERCGCVGSKTSGQAEMYLPEEYVWAK